MQFLSVCPLLCLWSGQCSPVLLKGFHVLCWNPPCSVSWGCCGLLASFGSSLLGISDEALTQWPEGRVTKSLLQNSLECGALAKLQEVMRTLPNVETKRHDSLQPRQLGGIKINKRKS